MSELVKVLAIGVGIGAAAWVLRDRLSADSETGEAATTPDLEDYAYQAIDGAAGYFEEGDQVNKSAFLQAIRLGEGTTADDGYLILVGGGRASGFAQHPALAGWRGWQMPLAMAQAAGYPNGAVSTAAGAYQVNRPTWVRVAPKAGVTDFSPESQDAVAWYLVGEKGAQADVLAGRIPEAVSKVRKIWASLPGAGYGQREVSLSAFLDAYAAAGGSWA
jgi:lysozyme